MTVRYLAAATVADGRSVAVSGDVVVTPRNAHLVLGRVGPGVYSTTPAFDSLAAVEGNRAQKVLRTLCRLAAKAQEA